MAIKNYKTKSTDIDGIKVELETYTEEGVSKSECHLSKKIPGKDFCSSLELVETNYQLKDTHSDAVYEVPGEILAKICIWVIDNNPQFCV